MAASPLAMSSLTAVTSIDGRYASTTAPLRAVASEFGLIKTRILVEVTWMIVQSETPEIVEVPAFSAEATEFLHSLYRDLTVEQAQKVKDIESVTKHDVKAIEYYMKARFAELPELLKVVEFIHFAATSEDINNLSWALIVKTTVHEHMLPAVDTLIAQLRSMAHQYAEQPMLAKTHGQPATPTTLGKEIANIVSRLRIQRDLISSTKIYGKFNGATGNYNAHCVAYPTLDWEATAATLVVSKLGLSFSQYTTQIECHDWNAALFNSCQQLNNVLLDANRDFWGYISFNYFKQIAVAGEIGSSTMPHKINPIDFENSEGQLGLANCLFQHMANKLPISRFQRDLTDSTVQRSMGTAFAHALIAYSSMLRGLRKLEVNTTTLDNDLNSNWEVLAEPIQTVMRKFNVSEPYEKLKALTRGKRVDAAGMQAFVTSLGSEISAEATQQLLALTPHSYIGYAAKLARAI